jgi:16S rRNA (cytosine967-C5)-methyltransferase
MDNTEKTTKGQGAKGGRRPQGRSFSKPGTRSFGPGKKGGRSFGDKRSGRPGDKPTRTDRPKKDGEQDGARRFDTKRDNNRDKNRRFEGKREDRDKARRFEENRDNQGGKRQFKTKRDDNRDNRDNARRFDGNKDNRNSARRFENKRGGQDGRKFSGDRRHSAPSDIQRPPIDPLQGGARAAAWEALDRILIDDGFTSLSLSDVMRSVRLSPRDKRLCTNIVYTTVEKLNYIDYALNHFLKDAENLDEHIRTLLRLSACQLLFMDRVPESAVVNEAVKLARARGYEGLTGLVNAVLRSFLRESAVIAWPEREDGMVPYLSVIYSMPEKLVEKFIDIYGEEQAEEIIKGNRSHRYLTIRPNKMRHDDKAFEEMLSQKEGWRVEKAQLDGCWYVSGTGDIAQDADFQKGHYSVQGESSVLAARAVDAKRGMTVLDCCAAPGGKTAYLAETMENTGRVQAWDLHPHRVELITKNAERLRLYNVRPMVRDATQLRDQMVETMDAVLLDAPCSGTGVLGDKPDAKYRFSEEKVRELIGLQASMLDTCCTYVKPGGTLVYATCSILPEENQEQVEAFLKRHPEFKLDSLPNSIPDNLRKKYGEHGLQILPGIDRMEGFFIARMVKDA